MNDVVSLYNNVEPAKIFFVASENMQTYYNLHANFKIELWAHFFYIILYNMDNFCSYKLNKHIQMTKKRRNLNHNKKKTHSIPSQHRSM